MPAGRAETSDPARILSLMAKRKRKTGARRGVSADAGPAETKGNPHDALAKQTFSDPKNAMALFERGLPAGFASLIDPGSLELERPSFVDGEFRESFADVLFSARIGDAPVLAYLLIEHQSTVDPLMPYRLLKYVARVWEWWLNENPGATKLPAVLPLVLHQGPRRWTGPRRMIDMVELPASLRGQLERFMPGFDMALVDLGEVEPDAFRTWDVQPSFRLTLAVMRSVNDDSVDVLALLEWLRPDLRATLQQPNGDELFRRAMLYLVLCRRGVDVGRLAKRATEIAGRRAGEVVMSTAQELVDQGVELGLKRGVTQGARNLLLRLLRASFGRVPKDVLKRLENASAEELEVWGERVLKAASIDEVFAGPRNKKKTPSGRGRRGKG